MVALDRHRRNVRAGFCLEPDEVAFGDRAVGGDVAGDGPQDDRVVSEQVLESRVQLAAHAGADHASLGVGLSYDDPLVVPGLQARRVEGELAIEVGLGSIEVGLGALFDAGRVLDDERLDLLGDLQGLRAAERQLLDTGHRIGRPRRIGPVPPPEQPRRHQPGRKDPNTQVSQTHHDPCPPRPDSARDRRSSAAEHNHQQESTEEPRSELVAQQGGLDLAAELGPVSLRHLTGAVDELGIDTKELRRDVRRECPVCDRRTGRDDRCAEPTHASPIPVEPPDQARVQGRHAVVRQRHLDREGAYPVLERGVLHRLLSSKRQRKDRSDETEDHVATDDAKGRPDPLHLVTLRHRGPLQPRRSAPTTQWTFRYEVPGCDRTF